MDGKLFEEAFSHFRNGKYEEAYSLLEQHKDDMPLKARQLMKECHKLITDKYFYIIKDCINEGDTDRAQLMKSQYNMRYGNNAKIDGIEIPCAGTADVLEDEPGALEKFYHSQAFVIACIVMAVIIVAIIIGSVKGCGGNSTADAYAEDTTATDTMAVDSLETEARTEFEQITKKRGNFSVDIQWPVSMEGIDDISSLQQSIAKAAFDRNTTDIEDCIERYLDDEERAAEENEAPYPCKGSIKIEFKQRFDDLYIFMIHYFNDKGCGTSSCVLSADEYIHYDNSLNRPLDLDDVIDYPSRVLRMINNHIEYYNPVSTDSVEGDIKYYEKAGEVPGRFAISPMGISFIFSKYEITPGVYGEPRIFFSYDELDDVLTDSFKEKIHRTFPRSKWISCKLTGMMVNHEGNNPISLAFEYKGDEIRNCVYTNELIGGKIKMRAERSGDYLVFSGKDGKYDFDIAIDRHSLEGKATDGPKVLDIYMYAD